MPYENIIEVKNRKYKILAYDNKKMMLRCVMYNKH